MRPAACCRPGRRGYVGKVVKRAGQCPLRYTYMDVGGYAAFGGRIRACTTVAFAADVGGDGRRAVQPLTGVQQRVTGRQSRHHRVR
jgi:hypothetical protein